MKKIWIIHNSLYGNSEKVARQLADGLKDSYDISLDHISNLSPEDIAKDEPYGLIIAVRILQFMSDRKIRKFIRGLNKAKTNLISKVAYFSTHGLKWRNFFIRGMKKTLKKVGCVGEICPDFLEVKVEGSKGPAEAGQDTKIEGYISRLKEFMK